MITRILAAALLVVASLAGSPAARAETGQPDSARRTGYSYIRGVVGDVTVASEWNGRVDAKRNMPISTGDEVIVSEAGRVEIGLADGNTLHLGGGTRARFESLSDQEGEDDDFSAIRLIDGSAILSATGASNGEIPRIDTEDATVYVSPGARARVNYDSRRGTVVIDRNGSVEVRTPSGSSKLRAGQYLMARLDEDAEIERGSFSRDRFDIWAADRLDQVSESRSVSARYVDPENASDVEALDGYGDWNYSQTYSSYVWSPRVDAGWSPYSVGSWYYTPAGLTWWSGDPWGWYPFHYGNWFFDASWNRWCWSPASVYSPAWVYWAYSPGYVGWCPIGWYSGYSPWWNNYYRHWGWDRPNVYLAIHGTFNPRQIDFRGGWNFSNAGGFGNRGRAEIIPGSRLGDRLGGQVAISSRPIVVPARPGEAREAVTNWVREAPRVIERSAAPDASRLAPILARERTLPAGTVEAMRERSVVADRGRLSGTAASDLAPRGASAERGRQGIAGGVPSGAARREPLTIERGRPTAIEPSAGGRTADPSGRALESPSWRGPARADRADRGAPAARPDDGWRSRGRNSDSAPASAAPAVPSNAPSGNGDWRSRSRRVPVERADAEAPPTRQDWRSRPDALPPARRVIEGAVPNRRADNPEVYRARPASPSGPREYRPEPRVEPRPQAPPPPPPAARTERAPERAAPAKSAPHSPHPDRGRHN